MKLFERIRSFFAAILAFFISFQLVPVNDTTYFKSFTPVLRFVVASDVHIDDADSVEEEKRLAELFKTAYKYASTQYYNKIDGVFFAGDVSNTGSQSSMNKFFSIVGDNVKRGTTVRAVLGNHEFYTDAQNTYNRFLTASGYSSVDEDIVIGGYHFICLCPDNNGNGYSQKKIDWLNNKLAAASAEDKTGKKPIFIFHHHNVSGTVYGSEDWGVSDLKSTLDKYPQVVDFSGHSHYPINDPRSIWQGTFTALGTGTLSYYEMGIAGVKTGGVFSNDKIGGYTTGRTVRDAAQYYIVEVDKNNAVRIKGYDILSGTFICEYQLRTVGNKLKFKYTDARAKKSETPEFTENAEITIIKAHDGVATLEIPQAECEDNVQHYRFEVYNSSGGLVKTIYRLSDTFYFPTPEAIRCEINGLNDGETYTVKCYAVSSWCKESKPLTTSVIIDKGHGKVSSYQSSVTPDVFSMVILDDGCAYDGVSGNRLSKVGDTAVIKDKTTGLNAGVFTSSNAYTYSDFKNSYDALKSSFSFEFYGTVKKFTNTSYVDLFANMGNGGMGFEMKNDGTIQFWAYVNDVYVVPSAEISFDEPVHLVGTFDGNNLKLFVNGTIMDTKSAVGTIKFPTAAANKFLCIGADSGTDGGLEFPFSGTVSVANVYSKALTAEEITTLYDDLTSKN